jgi:hypothetical protein
MIRRSAAAVLFFLALGPVRGADWKAEFLSYLGPKPDYRRALEFLTEQAKGMEAGDRQTADALAPYLAWKNGDGAEERDRISDYFEKYLDNDPEFGFLDDATHRDFLNFWGRWKSTYPLVTDVNFLSRVGSSGQSLPAGLEIGLEILNNAYYKISLGPYNLEGGFWPRGFHIMTVPVTGLFERSGTYEFTLDLKAGDIVVRKPIRIAVDLALVSSLRPAAPVLPEVRNGSKPAPAPALPGPGLAGPAPALPGPGLAGPAPAAASNFEGELSLYVGGKLIMRSRKIAAKAPPINIPLPGPSMRGQKPYMPPPKTDPMANSVSILDAIALTYMTLKDLLAKKPPAPSPPSYNKVTSLSFSFARAEADGALSDARAFVRVENARAVVLRK